MASHPHSTIYSPLDKKSREIRLIELDPTLHGTYRLHVVSLKDEVLPVFAAVSYVWGDPAFTAELVVEGELVTVRSSLACALANAYSHWERWSAQFPERRLSPCRLWADALCIDQDNIEEKNHQVSQMAEVYHKAELVICWLGPSDDRTLLAMDWIEIIARETSTSDTAIDWKWLADDLSNYIRQSFHPSDSVFISDLDETSEFLIPEEDNTTTKLSWLENYPSLWQDLDRTSLTPYHEVWQAIQSMMKLSYWRRVWIFQEIVLGRHCVLACGEKSISLDQVISTALWAAQLQKGSTGYKRPAFIPPLDWLRLTIDTNGTWSAIYKVLIAKSHSWDLLAKSSELDATPSANTMDPMYVGKTISVLRAEEKCWRELSWIGGSFRATNAKDYIYGVMGLTGINLYPEYSDTKSVGDVCYDYFNEWIKWLRKRRDFENHLGPAPNALWLLQHSGIGRLFEKPFSSHPSWVPNIPGVLDNESGFVDQSWVQSPGADFGVFDSVPELFQIQGSRLVNPAVLLDCIANTGPKYMHLPGKSAFPWLYDFIISRESYVTGRHPIMVALELVYGNETSKERFPAPTIQNLATLLKALFKNVFERRQRRTNSSSYSSEGSSEAPSSLILFLKEIGFAGLIGSHRHAKTVLALDGVDIADLGDMGTAETHRAVAKAVQEVALKIGLELVRLDLHADSQLDNRLRESNLRLAETEGGYIGLFPRGIEEGDVVCVLKGAHLPSVLRRAEWDDPESHFLHVGTCFVHGLMRGETVELVLSGKSHIETLDIR